MLATARDSAAVLQEKEEKEPKLLQ